MRQPIAVTGQEFERFRGSVVRSRWQRGGGLGSLDLSDDEIILSTPFGKTRRIERADIVAIHAVRFSNLVSLWTPEVSFTLVRGPLGVRFVPWRLRRLVAAMERRGWPVVAPSESGAA